MSYVGGEFDREFFLSYSRGDVAGVGDTDLARWSRMLGRQLQKELRLSCGEEIRFFFDDGQDRQDRIDPTAPLSDQLIEKISTSALLVAIVSDPYLRSTWCKLEREAWSDVVGEQEIGIAGRLLPVRAMPSVDDWPAELVDQHGDQLLGYHFFDREEEPGMARPFGWIDDSNNRDFIKAVLGLAGDIKSKLDEIRAANAELAQIAAEASRLQEATGQTVYLHGRTTSKNAWEESYQKLEGEGYTVFPDEPEAEEPDPVLWRQNKALRVQTLTGCDALLMVGANRRELAADLLVVGKDDRNLAREISQKFLPCAVIDSTGTPHARQRVIKERLGISWIEANADSWVPDVQSWLASSSQQVLA